MNLKVYTPNSSVYFITFGEKDKWYGKCKWLRITLDHDFYSLDIQSEVGNYQNTWTPPLDGETFVHMLARASTPYLIDRISHVKEFGKSKSIKATLRNIEEAPGFILTDEEKLLIKNAIEKMKDTNMDMYSYRLLVADSITNIAEDVSPSDRDELIAVCKEYPRGAVIISNIIQEYLIPELRKMI